MKIAITTSVIQGGKSGVAQYIFALVRSILKKEGNHKIHLYVFENDLHHFDFATDNATIIPVEEKWRPALKNIFWHQFILPKLLKQSEIDILHVPSYRRMVWNAPCKTVATIHDLAPFRVKGKYDILRMFYGRVIARMLARRQDQIITVSEATANDVEYFFGIPRSKQTVIYNGVDHERFSRKQKKTTPTRFSSEKKPYFLYISRLEHPAKNHVRLIDTFTEFKRRTGSNCELVLGGSAWHGAEHIYAAAERSEYSDDIRFPGFVSDEDLPELYQNAGAFIYPSLFEGFGLPPIEAMACGCPVISSGAGSLAEVVGSAALIVDPLDLEEMTSAMIKLSKDPELRKLLVRKGHERSSQFDWRICGDRVLDIYKSLPGTRSNRSVLEKSSEKTFVLST